MDSTRVRLKQAGKASLSPTASLFGALPHLEVNGVEVAQSSGELQRLKPHAWARIEQERHRGLGDGWKVLLSGSIAVHT